MSIPMSSAQESDTRPHGGLQPKVLVVDDDEPLRSAVAELLVDEGYAVRTAGSAEEALDRFRGETYHLVLCDLQLPGRSGISLIKTLHETCPATACVLVTGHGSVRTAVTALKRGAVEYMTKPVKPRRLLTLCRALTADLPEYLPNKLLAPAGGRAETIRVGAMIARSRVMQGVFERLEQAARSDTTVLLVGESGTGKELAARTIHQRSARADGPFVAVRLGATAPGQCAAELFGRDRTPGQLELAEGGTLFLDEIAALDGETQASLLRALETLRYTPVGGAADREGGRRRRERTADVRVIAASNRNLAALVARGELREDLYYRLSVFTVELPPLRAREGDVPALATELLRDLAERHARDVSVIPPETQRLLSNYSWPGNVRELRNVIEQAMLLARGGVLEPSLLPAMIHREPPRKETIQIPIGTSMDAIEREVILRTLEAHEGNKTAAAEALGISRRSIYNKLAEYGLKADNDVAGR